LVRFSIPVTFAHNFAVFYAQLTGTFTNQRHQGTAKTATKAKYTSTKERKQGITPKHNNNRTTTEHKERMRNKNTTTMMAHH
jgi:hypothetical protein